MFICVKSKLQKNKNYLRRKWVTVVTVSHWYEEMFQNWLFWYKNLNLEMETILIAEDPIIYKKYMNSTEFMTINYSVKKVSKTYTRFM